MIDSNEGYLAALKRIEKIQDLNETSSPEEEKELQDLAFEISEYEHENHKLPDPNLKDKLTYAMEQFGMEVSIGMKDYKTIIKYSDEDDVFHGKLEGVDNLIMFEGNTIDEVCDAFIDAIGDYTELQKQLKD